MKKAMKKVMAAVMAAVIAAGTLGMSASAYEIQKYWSINYMNHAPSYQPGLTPSCTRTIDTYGGGYQTNCTSIYGANDRYVLVKAPGITDFIITTTGYSSVKNPEPDGFTITFSFYGRGETSCVADGTLGYYK